ncbi:MAG TPA: hypothetical protein VKA58_11280 [Propionibacteriaceae bacterium]|nr:hypothetical protein [Propionibacteriaceae bacterium]
MITVVQLRMADLDRLIGGRGRANRRQDQGWRAAHGDYRSADCAGAAAAWGGQTEERLAMESDWPESDLVSSAFGDPIYPDTRSQLLPKLIEQHNEQHPATRWGASGCTISGTSTPTTLLLARDRCT